ncbi:hypothetical protein [Streptomyces sp. TP-A0356]|uniref:hypothetical protein n=1 Tax=Streptomyces sp. TP-A0356 TaxID=1359208 RepID=UPI0006E1A65F|nr:hypothetical protein [Streptomyces sp. TP-A0356]
MSPTPYAPRTVHRCARLWVLLMLVALLAAGAHTEAMAPETVAVSAAQACDAEHDVPFMAPRPTGPRGHRAAAPPCPGHRGGARPSGPDCLTTARARAPYPPALHALRTVVLRC